MRPWKRSSAPTEETEGAPAHCPHWDLTGYPWGRGRMIKRIQRDEELGLVQPHGGVKAGSQGATEDTIF